MRSTREYYSGSRFFPNFVALHSDARFPHLLRRIGASQDSILTITETTLSETADPNAQSHLTLKVGVKPRPGTQNGHAVRIIVSFYDLTKDNKMKPTDARVGYNWLTACETGRMRLRSSSQRLTCVRRPKRLHLTDVDMADSLSECISTANYRIREQLRQSY